jgi:hypothetical protein
VVSAISLAEIVYLVEKNRLPENAYVDLKAALDDPDHVLKEARAWLRLSMPWLGFRAQMFPTCRTGLSLPRRFTSMYL